MTVDAAIAMNRFGLGAKAGQAAPAKPRHWLLDQLGRYDARPATIASLPSRARLAKDYSDHRRAAREFLRLRNSDPDTSSTAFKTMEAERKKERRKLRGNYSAAVTVRFNTALASEADFAERLVHFWSNHFAISIDRSQVVPFAGNYEFEAVRPHVLGNFSDMLTASVAHPAMLLFLDQAQSIGPNSVVAERRGKNRRRKLGLNENLAREVLELYTLGARADYDQNDVTELARALTGLTVPALDGGRMFQRLLGDDFPLGDTKFIAALHEPGARQIMGVTYPAAGRSQLSAILGDLAVHPATARHIATKLAQHFVSDVPPPALVARLEQNFLATGGDLPSLYRVLVESPESWPASWDLTRAKFKSPWDWMVSSMRMVGLESLPEKGNNRPDRVANLFKQLGQPIWHPGSPAGYPDKSDSWAGAAALMRRVELAAEVGRTNSGRFDARSLAPEALPGVLSANTLESIARAESPAQGLSLLLVSPEFLRR